MAVEKIFTINNWNISSVSWGAYFNTIDALGLTQISVYYRLSGTTTWVFIEKSSYKDTFVSSSKSINLRNATFNSGGSSVPANLDVTKHELKIERSTSLTPYIEFQNGAKLDATDINTVGRQALHRIEEEAARLDASDVAIYAYVDNRFLDYYTKTQIDSFFNTQTVPNWATGVDYQVGDTVLHNDPNDGLNTILVWYATVDHASDTSVNQPSSTGSGPSYWSVVAPNDSIANLSFIRRIPGIVTTENEWNTIQPANVNASGLIFKPNANQVAPLIKTFKEDGTTASLTLTSGTNSSGAPTSQDNLHLASTVLSTESDSWFQYTGLETSYFNFRSSGNPTITNPQGLNGVPPSPIVAIAPRAAQDSLQMYGANNALSWRVNSAGQMFCYKEATFEGATFNPGPYNLVGAEGYTGTYIEVNNGKVVISRDVSFGLPSGGETDPYTEKMLISRTTGSITTDGNFTGGNVTASGTVQAAVLKTTGVQNADYLKTNASGEIIVGTGTPTTSRSSIGVASSNTSLSNGDVVYRSNANGLWAKAQSNDPTTLAFGVVDNVQGSSGNQNFDVVVTGAVTYTGWNLSDATHRGNWVWLDKDTAGGLTTTNPADDANGGRLVDPVGVVTADNTIYVVPARPHKTPVTTAATLGSGTSSIVNASDALITSLSTNDTLKWNGTRWINVPIGSSGVTDHGALSGLTDDDHSQYALADGSRGSFAASSHTHALAQITDSGTAAALDVGTTANKIVQLDGSAKLPAVDGSQLTNIASGGNSDWKVDPSNTGVVRLFDDFVGGNTKSWLMQGTSGSYWEDGWEFDDSGASASGFIKWRTAANQYARNTLSLSQILNTSASDGNEALFQVRAKSKWNASSTTPYFGISAFCPKSDLSPTTTEPSAGYGDTAKFFVYNQKGKSYIVTGGYNNEGTNGSPSETNTDVAVADDTWFTFGIHVKYVASASAWRCQAYVNGVAKNSTFDLTTGTQAPTFAFTAYNASSGHVNEGLVDWAMVQYTRPSSVVYINIDDI